MIMTPLVKLIVIANLALAHYLRTKPHILSGGLGIEPVHLSLPEPLGVSVTYSHSLLNFAAGPCQVRYAQNAGTPRITTRRCRVSTIILLSDEYTRRIGSFDTTLPR